MLRTGVLILALLLPAPSVIGQELIEVSNRGLLWKPMGETLLALRVGLGASLLFGFPAGILIGASRGMDRLRAPSRGALRARPRCLGQRPGPRGPRGGA